MFRITDSSARIVEVEWLVDAEHYDFVSSDLNRELLNTGIENFAALRDAYLDSYVSVTEVRHGQ